MEVSRLISTFFKDLVLILGEMAPFLLIGFFFAGLLYAFIPQRKIEHYFSGEPLRSSLMASLFGIPLPLCSCGVIPTGAALYANGASKGGTVSFLISTPQTGVDSLFATYALMGLPFAILRPIAAFLTGITGGYFTGVFTKSETRKKPIEVSQNPSLTFLQKLKVLFKYGFVDFIQDVSKWLVIGLILAAFISALIPDNFFEVLNLSPVIQMLLVLVVSIPLYVCATGSIPMAAVLLIKGLSPGAAFVFLMAGPATNAATITMIGKVLGRRSLIVYLATIIIGALGFGLIIDYLLPLQWFAPMAHINLDHSHGSHLTLPQIASGIILVVLIINGYIQKHIRPKPSHNQEQIVDNMNTKKIRVDGMTCNHCKLNVETNLVNIEGVEEAQVNLKEKTVNLKGERIDTAALKETINSLGYQYIDIIE